MTFLEYIKNVVANFSWIWILEIVVMALVFYWAWAFFKKKNAVWLAYFAFGAVVLVFAASLLGLSRFKVEATPVKGSITIWKGTIMEKMIT